MMNSKDTNQIKNSNNHYVSTRSDREYVTASEAIVNGLSADGGLYVPDFLDQVRFDLNELSELNYVELTIEILSAFLRDFSREQVEECVKKAYSDKFDTPELVKITENGDRFYTELWHGPTAAFKDMALTLLPHLLTCALENTGEDKEVVILTATSGDTGKAALEGFKDVADTEIITFYPRDGVSATQERQMITTGGENTHVISVVGNFDDAQNGVKEIFNDREFNEELREAGYLLSSANSINIGRLLPQIVYYYYSYFELVRRGVISLGEAVDFVVPSGNFGDILAGYYAKLTGLPIDSLICASNINKILTDFFTTGVYDTNREFYKTTSPSMDILISSNLERLLYDALGHDSTVIKALMESLKSDGVFKMEPSIFRDFKAGYAEEGAVLEKIKEVYDSTGYLIDPHTAVGSVVSDEFKTQNPVIILSTANPYKFSRSVYEAIFPESGLDEFELQRVLSEKTGVPIPEPLKKLEEKEIRHTAGCLREDMKDAVRSALEVSLED